MRARTAHIGTCSMQEKTSTVDTDKTTRNEGKLEKQQRLSLVSQTHAVSRRNTRPSNRPKRDDRLRPRHDETPPTMSEPFCQQHLSRLGVRLLPSFLFVLIGPEVSRHLQFCSVCVACWCHGSNPAKTQPVVVYLGRQPSSGQVFKPKSQSPFPVSSSSSFARKSFHHQRSRR